MANNKMSSEGTRIHAVRRRNFHLLFAEWEAANPGRGAVRRFAEAHNLPENYITQLRSDRKNIGDEWAMKLEKAFKKPKGWLDQHHTELEPRDQEERVFLETAAALYREHPNKRMQMLEFLIKLLRAK